MKTTSVVGIGIAVLVALGAVYVLKTQFSPEAKQRQIVKSKLNDPESAVFRDDRQSSNPQSTNVWCGEVNARNRMGGMVGFTRYIAEIEEDRSLAFLDRITLDDSRDEGFAAQWRAFCEYSAPAKP